MELAAEQEEASRLGDLRLSLVPTVVAAGLELLLGPWLLLGKAPSEAGGTGGADGGAGAGCEHHRAVAVSRCSSERPAAGTLAHWHPTATAVATAFIAGGGPANGFSTRY